MLLRLPIDDPKKAVLATCARPAVQVLNSFLADVGIRTRPEADRRGTKARAECWVKRGRPSEERVIFCRGLKKPIRIFYRVPLTPAVDLAWLDRQARHWLDKCGMLVDKVSYGVVGSEWRFGFETETTPDVLFALGLGEPEVQVKSKTSRKVGGGCGGHKSGRRAQ